MMIPLLQDTENLFVRACKDQGGSRLLQDILERSSSAEVVPVLEKLRLQLLSLMRVRPLSISQSGRAFQVMLWQAIQISD